MIKENTKANIKPGYKKTPVGIIPEDWEVKKLAKIGSFYKGKGISKSQLSETGLKAIRYGEIYTVHHYFIKQFYSFIDRNVAKASFPLISGDLLFTGSGETLEEIGKSVAFIGEEEVYAGGDIIILRPDKNSYNSKFLGFITNNDIFRKQTFRVGQGNAVVHIYPSNLKNLKLPIPPLPEQKAIADCLTTWDRAIEKQKKLINAKKLQKKGLMQQIFNGQLKVENACPEQGRKGQLIQAKDGEDFTKEWKEVRLGEVLKESKIISKENDKFKRISVRLHLEGVDQRPVRGTEADSTTFYKRKAGQFIYGKQNFHNGALGIIPEEFDGFETTSDIPSFDINDKINHKWFFYYVSRFDFYRKMESRTMGTGSKRLHPNELFSTKIPYPSLEEQTAIAEFLQTADKEIELLEKQLTQLELQKKGLMQVLLTGEKRLVS